MIKFTQEKIKWALVVALAVISNAAMAQDIKVTSKGNAVANNQVVETPCDVEDYTEYGAGCFYRWDPEIEVSTESGEMPITVTLTAGENTYGTQLCWPMNCQAPEPGKSVTSTGTIGTTPSNLQIHRDFLPSEEFENEEKPTKVKDIKVKIDYASKSFEFTVKFMLPENTAVYEISNDSNAIPVYYSIDGTKVENPGKGLFIVKKGNKAKLELFN
ncbi:MAG: hypothetical protein K2K25_09245 [Muribaculaceae bacterium]|nr:hypothetical protein [Muribaculaceae bacterium]